MLPLAITNLITVAVLDRQRWADFPLLSAIIIDKRNGELRHSLYAVTKR